MNDYAGISHNNLCVAKESPLFWELDGETGKVVDRVSHQAETAMVSGKDVTNEQKSEALTLWLGGEERREQMGCNGRRDSSSVVGDDEL